MSPESDSLHLLTAALCSVERNVPDLRAARWPDIQEAFEDDLTPAPEDEFLVNALEALRLGNLRWGLLETTMGLEIVLSRFLQTCLATTCGLPSRAVREALSPDTGLQLKVSVLLPLAAR